jgi:hypothetical protein
MSKKAEAAEPTWAKGTAVLKIKGMKPATVAALKVQMPDGNVASTKTAQEVAVWPAVRLRVVFDAFSLWWGAQRTPWHKAAVSAAIDLARLVSPKWIVQDNIDRLDEPVLKPEPFSRSAAARHVARTLFATRPLTPWTVLRSGGALSVRYDASVLVLKSSVQVFLPPTAANVALLEKVLDRLPHRLTFAWAGVGFGLAGWASSVSLDAPSPGKLEKKKPAMDADWVVLIGDRWRASPAQEALLVPLECDEAARKVERRGSFVRISVPRPASPDDARAGRPARKLASDLAEVARKMQDLRRRAVLRKPLR